MKNFMATTAIALVIGTTALAEQHMTAFSDAQFNATMDLNASDLIGARVHATEIDTSGMEMVGSAETAEWDDIGEINDIILTRDGSVQSVIVGVGGFLGMGEKDVSINMEDLRFVSDGEDSDDYILVITATAAGIKDAPSYERTAMSVGGAEDAMGATMTAESMEEKVDDQLDYESRATFPPKINREGYAATRVDDLTAEDLTGARVYGANDEDVGEIDELLMGDSGQIDRAVIDVGGFLGMGERPVAVAFDDLTLMRSDDGGDVRVYIDSSKEMLESRPEYDG